VLADALPEIGEIARLRQEAHSYRSLHARALERIERIHREHGEQLEALRAKLKSAHDEIRQLEARNSELRALVKLRAKQAFGKTSERRPGRTGRTRPRKAHDAQGHGRRDLGDLRVVEERNDLPDDQKHCARCGKARRHLGDNCADFVEVEVRGYVRRVVSPQYAKTCHCPGEPSIVSAPGPARLMARNTQGISVWVLVLMDKFYFQRPTHRLLGELEAYEIPLARSTLTECERRLQTPPVWPRIRPLDFSTYAGRNDRVGLISSGRAVAGRDFRASECTGHNAEWQRAAFGSRGFVGRPGSCAVPTMTRS
jgi:transposase